MYVIKVYQKNDCYDVVVYCDNEFYLVERNLTHEQMNKKSRCLAFYFNAKIVVEVRK